MLNPGVMALEAILLVAKKEKENTERKENDDDPNLKNQEMSCLDYFLR